MPRRKQTSKRTRASRAAMPAGQPVFVIHEGAPGAVTRTIRVFASGRVEGIDAPYAVVNHLPGLLDKITRAIGDRCGLIAAGARQELGL